MRSWMLGPLLLLGGVSSLRFDGWYNCSEGTFWSRRVPASARLLEELVAPFADVSAVPATAQCGLYFLPLCYKGVCTSDKSIPVFVKRLPATSSPRTAKVLWVLQGGPGASSVNMEPLMIELYERLQRTVTVMTMDHRGTGRSSRLECQAAQAMTRGSPRGSSIAISELPDCLRDINFVYGAGNAAGFSVTSAARDILTVVDSDQSKQEVYLYGVSYGTLWVERTIAIQNAQPTTGANIRGYVLDGIVPHSGPVRLFFHDWDRDMSNVGVQFLDLCRQDAYCRSKFTNQTLPATVAALYRDVAAESTGCATLVNTELGGLGGLKTIFGSLLMHSTLRLLIPIVVYRLARCRSDDMEVVVRIFDFLSARGYLGTSDDDDDALDSEILYATVAYGEMWNKQAPPSYDSIKEQFESGVMGLKEYTQFPYYCMYTASTSSDCLRFTASLNVSWSYPLDRYDNQPLRIPKGASVLLLNGGMDPQTPLHAAQSQFEQLQGTQKKLLTFPYAPHAISYVTWMHGRASTCGAELILSYVRVGGALAALDTSCTRYVLRFTFELTAASGRLLAGVNDLYDGVPTTISVPVNVTKLEPVTPPPPTTMPSTTNSTSIDVGASPVATSSGGHFGDSMAGLFGCLFVVAAVVAVKLYRENKALRELHVELCDEADNAA
ncbi:hypothetical protein SDRG_02910 [Saprolegnia diclina VS20]|uniref:Peptidase S33 tripeptidyl aminopeptidase-like C-terminal domain-containing protein n=1 Tax=Saprolegnia diclina (strain VS20) TaxID=1156394 RepID=T0QXU3_SAPDV|nr:hypothetical protein SDRG_02910 [Saprolegnia diclina VS20]EQC39466.1 hypothetical protein SDRG_02910 [Saprolegnia diclina VS20]|eukprot:XP_008606738.1 hypothetical protein SDRG_02910 [Saprolegnia diclina VS20]